jgi:hypothetical protein
MTFSKNPADLRKVVVFTSKYQIPVEAKPCGCCNVYSTGWGCGQFVNNPKRVWLCSDCVSKASPEHKKNKPL